MCFGFFFYLPGVKVVRCGAEVGCHVHFHTSGGAEARCCEGAP